MKKVPCTADPADVLTKPKSYWEAAGLLESVGVHVRSRQPLLSHATVGPNRDLRVGSRNPWCAYYHDRENEKYEMLELENARRTPPTTTRSLRTRMGSVSLRS